MRLPIPAVARMHERLQGLVFGELVGGEEGREFLVEIVQGRLDLHVVGMDGEGGLANDALSFFAGHTVNVDWLAQTWTGNAVIWLLGIWKGVGWSFIMYLAALDGVPRDQVEAARVDGAGGLRLWLRIILPSVRATTIFVLVLLVIGGTQVFTQVYLLTVGGPYGSTQVLFTYVYQLAFTNFAFSYAAALASMIT